MIKSKTVVQKEIVKEESAGLEEEIKMMGNTHVVIITEYECDEFIKQKQIAEWIRIQYPTICHLQETHMRQVDT